MSASNLLTQDQITIGSATLVDNKLQPTQVEDLLSIFREFLGSLADDYSIETTLTNCSDTGGSQKCAKLATCLLLWQDYQFLNGGFSATNANRTGFNFSIDDADFKIFKYAFGLFWNLPDAITNKYQYKGANRKSQFGQFVYDRN